MPVGIVTAPSCGVRLKLSLADSPPPRSLVSFDMTALPAGTTAANITKATLTSFVNKVAAGGMINFPAANGVSAVAAQAVRAWLTSTANDGFSRMPKPLQAMK